MRTPEHDQGPPEHGPGDIAGLARRHGLELTRFAYVLCGDRQRAEDLVQDVLLRMHRRFPDLLPLDSPVSYARRALVNANVSRARLASSREIVSPVPDRATPDQQDPADRDVLWQALLRLPVRQRTVLVLRFYLDAADQDIAQMLDCRAGTVRSLASRALARMRNDPTLDKAAGNGDAP